MIRSSFSLQDRKMPDTACRSLCAMNSAQRRKQAIFTEMVLGTLVYAIVR